MTIVQSLRAHAETAEPKARETMLVAAALIETLESRSAMALPKCAACQGHGGRESPRRGWIPCDACNGRGF